MNLVFDIIIIMACLGGLWIGASWLVESSGSIARKIGIFELVIGLRVISAPVFAVTILSALKGHANIS
ncbi:MAG: hypothetical protein GY857_09505 [Desulfobacula sp.]|nr:hypothetical protein [Desulfobacula sp.]